MKRLFDPEVIRAQIANLQADRERIDQAIRALEAALRNIEELGTHQKEFPLFNPSANQETTLQDAVKGACLEMVDDITRQRVLAHIQRQYPALKPNSSSVSAALINLAKPEIAILKVADKGRGRSPSIYSTENDMTLELKADEIQALTLPINGVGGWQSLFQALQKQFDKAKGTITLTPALRARIHHYYQNYGTGGFQTRAKAVFSRELPHLFVA